MFLRWEKGRQQGSYSKLALIPIWLSKLINADAISKAQPGAWAPAVQMGGSGKEGGSRATDLVDLMTAKTAKELGVDLSVKGGAAVKK